MYSLKPPTMKIKNRVLHSLDIKIHKGNEFLYPLTLQL